MHTPPDPDTTRQARAEAHALVDALPADVLEALLDLLRWRLAREAAAAP